MLTINTKTVNEVDYDDVDQAIAEFLKSKGFDLGRRYECVCEEEWQNDMKKEWQIEPNLPKDYDLKRFAENNFGFRTRTILDWMCADGLIPAGNYLIDVSW